MHHEPDFSVASDLSAFTGTHFVCTYDTGWKYEWSARNGTIFFPQWIAGEGQHPGKTLCHSKAFIEDMYHFRDKGPACPYVAPPGFATATYMKNEGPDNDAVINMPPGLLPADYFNNK